MSIRASRDDRPLFSAVLVTMVLSLVAASWSTGQVGDRSTEIFRDMPSQDLGRACGLAAAEVLGA